MLDKESANVSNKVYDYDIICDKKDLSWFYNCCHITKIKNLNNGYFHVFFTSPLTKSEFNAVHRNIKI